MALPVLDGNQSATTLSSVVTGGEHIVAHTVVSLGSTAISNITSAISGSVVSVSNFPATQTIAGTVTANCIARSVNDASDPQFLPLPVIGYDENIEDATRGIVVPVQLSFDQGSVNDGNPLPISGTVTANAVGRNVYGGAELSLPIATNGDTFPADGSRVGVQILGDDGLGVGQGSSCVLPISGTVTANGGDFAKIPAGETLPPAKAIRIGFGDDENWNAVGLASGGNPLPVGVYDAIGNSIGFTSIGGNSYANVNVGNSVTIGSLPRVTFIDGSGSVTTANSAITVFAASTTRSYLLVQVTTGSAFVNVGATATTVNGINLTAGQGYAWETTIPQGLVSLISTTTSSRWVAKEA